MSSEPHGRAWLLLSECFLPSFFFFSFFLANVDDTLGFLLTPQISGIFNGEARELMWSRAECAARRCAVITACFFPPHARTRTHIRKHTSLTVDRRWSVDGCGLQTDGPPHSRRL